MLVAEIANLLLAGSLLPESRPEQHLFARSYDPHQSTSSSGGASTSHLPAMQISQLVEEPIEVDEQQKLSYTETSRRVAGEVETTALRWWTELSGGGINVEEGDHGRRNSLFSMGGGAQDEEVELGVTVLVSDGLTPYGELTASSQVSLKQHQPASSGA